MRSKPVFHADFSLTNDDLRVRGMIYIDGQPRLAELRQRLLGRDGIEVHIDGPEDELEELLARGRFYSKRRLTVQLLEESECHSNAACLWFESQGTIRIVTGYALCWDGIWVSHSWGVEGGRIIETNPGPYERYFGLELTARQALRFALSNLPPDLLDQLEADLTEGEWPRSIMDDIVAEVGGDAPPAPTSILSRERSPGRGSLASVPIVACALGIVPSPIR
jgi:hypothetical protein